MSINYEKLKALLDHMEQQEEGSKVMININEKEYSEIFHDAILKLQGQYFTPEELEQIEKDLAVDKRVEMWMEAQERRRRDDD